ncbi:FUSC family protein [Tomitella biformata]|uniref:FUSC family protein n=1 Tax=Tomitella biformata TaxID=630403 RepID=UPI000465A7DF|nr:FUSC family protein [Tomitella biformata]
MLSLARGLRLVTQFVAATDPGRLRLRGAATTTLSAALAMAVLLTATRMLGQPVTIAILGTIVALQAAAMVKDRTQRDRVITTLLVPLPAIGAVTAATLLQGAGYWAEIGFIAVLFGAVWVRRYGKRGTALGMVAFIAYFFTLFLAATPHQIPVLGGAIVLGVAMTLLVRTLILPERPRLEIRRLAAALRASSVQVLAAASTREGRDVARLRRRLDRLGATAMMIEDWLDRHAASLHVSVTSEALSLRVFDAQIATEQLASALWALDPETPWPRTLGQATTALSSCLQDRCTPDQLRAARLLAAEAAEKADPSTAAGIATMVAQRAVTAHIAIHRVTTKAMETPEPLREPIATAGEAAEEPAGKLVDRWAPSTKAAIQVAVATSVATVVGELISPDRWYWAVMAAFVVFTGASTRGEILSRAGQRIVGTIAGVLAGVLIAALVGHNPPVQLVLILVCVFFAYYLAPVAYGLLTFFLTMLLATLYGLLGVFSVEVLEIRVEETAAGALIGIASSYLILSTKTREALTKHALEYVDELAELIDTSVAAVLSPGHSAPMIERARALDQILLDLVDAAKPLELGPTTRSRHGARRLVRLAQASSRSAHALARAGLLAARADPDTAPSEQTAAALRDAVDHVQGNVALARLHLAGEKVPKPEKATETTVLDVMLTATKTPGPRRAALRALSRLNRTVLELIS